MSENTNTLITRSILALGTATLLAASAGAGVSSGLIVNGSFEKGPAQVGGWTHVLVGGTEIPGWKVVNGNVDHMGTMWAASHGHHSLDLNGTLPGEIEQWVPTTPGTEYLLTFMLSANWGGPQDVKRVLVHAGESQAEFDFDSSAVTSTNMQWSPREVSFHALTDSTRIAFNSLSPANWGAAIDDVRLVAVPTPGAGALAVLGAAGLAGRRRRG